MSEYVTTVPFFDLRREYARRKTEIDRAIGGVLERGAFILGAENAALEGEFADYCRARQAVLVASGTDALSLALRACDVGPGDEVITVSHTAIATIAAIRLLGARPVLVDVVDETLTMDVGAAERAITHKTKAIVPVHLYGLPADVNAVADLASRRGLAMVEDAAQAHGATVDGRCVGSFGRAAAFSFYPTKNVGAYGDGGAIVTNEEALAERVRFLRQYGWGKTRYVSESEGTNSRMDELQAAIVRVKLRGSTADARARQAHARAYDEALRDLPLRLPSRPANRTHAFHLYVVRTPLRDELRRYLAARGVETAIHYPAAAHEQAPYREFAHGSLAVTERALREIVSLPLYPDLRPDERELVIDGIRGFFGERRS